MGAPQGDYIITELGVKGVAQDLNKWSPMCSEENMMASNTSSGCVRGEVAQIRVSSKLLLERSGWICTKVAGLGTPRNNKVDINLHRVGV